MKQLIFLALGALTTPALSYAQAGQPVQFGVKAGAGLSTLVGNGSNATALPLVVGVGGLFATVPLGTAQRWFLQPELLYSPQGYRMHYPDLGDEYKFRSDFLTLPLLLGLKHGGFFAAVGPQVSYQMHARNLYRLHDPFSPATSPAFVESVNNYLSANPRWQLAAVASIGYRWPSGVGLELRYSNALIRQQISFDNPYYYDFRIYYLHAYSLSAQVQASYVLPWH